MFQAKENEVQLRSGDEQKSQGGNDSIGAAEVDASLVLSDIWKIVEEAMCTTIPAYLKRLLQLQGFGNFVSLKELDKSDLEYLETYVTSGKLKCKVGPNLQYYLPENETASQFALTRGDQKLLLKVVDYVNRNHNIVDKKLATKRIFNLSKGTDSFTENASCSKKPKSMGNFSDNTSDLSTVPSIDILSEIRTVRSIVLQYCKTKDRMPSFVDKVKKMEIRVEVFEGVKGASLKACIMCPICKKKQSAFREPTKCWIVSNFTRHLKSHCNNDKSQTNLDGMLITSEEKSSSEI